MDIRNIPVDEIVLDDRLYLRDKLDDFTVERYADSWERLPPVTVYEVDGKLLMADGFHRHAAAVMLNKRTIPAEVRKGTFTEALDFVSTVNLFHGLPLSRSERRRAVEVKLKLHPDWSDRRLAEGMGVGRELIAKVRRQLVEAGQVPGDLGRVGSDGKTYSAGIPREPTRGKAVQQEEPREREREREREPERGRGKERETEPPWEERPAPVGAGRGDKRMALTGPVEVTSSTIDEMLEMMARQVMEIVNWTMVDGFTEAYHSAKPHPRGLFQSAVIKLAARANQLRRG
jgi:ParB-like chromosome segregation protein Spo0J